MFFKKFDVDLSLYCVKTVDSCFNILKIPISKSLQTDMIYCVQCGDCEGCYVGQTQQLLGKRIYNHSNDCKSGNAGNPNNTALAEHKFDTRYYFKFDLEDVRILDPEVKYNRRMISEAIHINIQDNTINRRSDSDHLSRIYSILLKCATINWSSRGRICACVTTLSTVL